MMMNVDQADNCSKVNITMPSPVKELITKLEEAGFEAYAVGGCVRDSLLNRDPADWDITTSALPQQVKKVFGHTIDTGIKHGTVTVMKDHTGYEITTFRVDGKYGDGRHPDNVTFTPSLEEDLKRRDFTINAMAYNDRTGLVDLFGGCDDLKCGIIRAVGDPEKRFTEDALRMLRAVRFAAQLGFKIEDATAGAIKDMAPSLSKISAERILSELEKLLVSPHPEEMLTLNELGLTAVFLPEFDIAVKTQQNNPHHCFTVGMHTTQSLKNTPPDRILRLTMLFHDLGKPAMQTVDEKGIHHFKGHPELSAGIADERLHLLKTDNNTIDDVTCLIRYHDLRIEPSKTAVRKLLSKLGKRRFELLLQVQDADILAQSSYLREEKMARQQQIKDIFSDIIKEGDCFSLSSLNINGNDLMALGYEKGPSIGSELGRLLDLVLEDPSLNKKEGDCFSLSSLNINGNDLMALGYEKGPSVGSELGRLLELVLEDPSLNKKDELTRLAKEHLCG